YWTNFLFIYGDMAHSFHSTLIIANHHSKRLFGFHEQRPGLMPGSAPVGVFFPLTGIGLLVFSETGFNSWHPLAKTSRTHQ
ncbi:hypothetical protein ACK2K2_006295, partial [Pseudomonas aeruginosa]|uniref:hypothetical protein n=4 Tax=Pseudomonas aeruginosa TaxID=287 RepID=UPI001C9DBCD6